VPIRPRKAIEIFVIPAVTEQKTEKWNFSVLIEAALG
jgi:hypothetical protein